MSRRLFKTSSLAAAAIVLCVVGAATAAHAVPVRMNHQGRFVADDGLPIGGAHTIVLTLWDAPAGGASVWTEQFTVQLDDGYYALMLGGDPGNPLDSDRLGQYPLFVGIALDGAPEFSPRQEVGSVPYAILTDTAVNVDGGYADVDSVAINGGPVIDQSGHWVGPAIYDGSDFALSSQACAPGQLVSGIGPVGALVCAEAVQPGEWLPAGDVLGCNGTDKVRGVDPVTGDVICGADLDSATTYAAGDGLELNGNVFSVLPGQFVPVGAQTECGGTDKVRGVEPVTGNVICGPDVDTDTDTDTNTTYAAGDGLELNGNVFAVVPGRFVPVGAATVCNGSDKVRGLDPATGDVICGADIDTDTDSNTTYAAGPGLVLNGNVFSVRPGQFVPVGTETQCSGSDKVRGLDPASGNVICGADVDTDTDSNTTYQAGAGLQLAGTTFSVTFGAGGSSNLAVRHDDPRLSNERPPAAGSNNYIQNQFAGAQPANFNISGQAVVGSVLSVNGGAVYMQGKETLNSGDGWLRLNQAGNYPAGVHTPGNLAPGALNVGGANGWGNPGGGNMWVAGASTMYGSVNMQQVVNMSICRLCFFYADEGGNSSRRAMCVKFVDSNWTGWMQLAGDVDGNDIVSLKYMCDNGPSGVFNGWPGL